MSTTNSSNDPGQSDVLIVDDTPENLRLLSNMLSRRGYRVRKAISGSMALTAVQTLPPDLILLDIMMPEMDGYAVCQQLKARTETADIPVIFLSALNEAFDKVKAFGAGGSDYIAKPFQLEEVIVRVQNQLELKAAERQIRKLNLDLEQRVDERTAQLQQRTRQLEAANRQLLDEIRERERMQKRLKYMAFHDRLTDLPNRTQLEAKLQTAFEQQMDEMALAVLFIDCDRFKVVNDSLGHAVGDELLRAIAQRLQSCLPDDGVLARWGGDEFVMLLETGGQPEAAIALAENVLAATSEPYPLSRHEVFVNTSIGIAFSTTQDSPDALLRDADAAMYRSKILGGNRYHVFDPGLHEEAIERLALENDLRHACDRGEFELYYQPIMNLQTGELYAFEALIRWNHPQRGFVSPGAFVPTIEETGLIDRVGEWVLQEACRQLYTWQREWQQPLMMSVNLSVRQFAQPDFVERVERAIVRSGVEPQFLKLEITESALMENAKATLGILQRLKSRQIHISIDDFGTGYSSLSYLHHFPVDTLKIDRSFVMGMDDSEDGLGLVPAILNLARATKVHAIAEGVETRSQRDRLRQLGCQFAQGYLFSRPLPAGEVAIAREQFLAQLSS